MERTQAFRYPIRYADTLPGTADVVVIGGGILGAATAFYAGRAGLRCAVVEKRSRLCSLTTPASTGAFRAQFDNPEEMRLVQESIAAFERFDEHVGLVGLDIRLTHQGYLWLTTTAEGAARQRRLVELQQSWGLTDVELLTGEEARRRFPYLAPEVVSARYRPGDGWLDVKRVTNGFAAGSGATFCLETAATGFALAGGAVKGVRTTWGTIACDQVVVAAGPFSGVVAGWAGLHLDLALRIRQKLVIPQVPEVPPAAPMTIDEDTGAHWRPALQGAYLLYTQHDTLAGPPLDDVPTSAGFYFGLLDPASPHSVARIAPFWRSVWERNDDLWCLMGGQYTYTLDHRPLLGPTEIPGLHLNTGYSGHGIMGSAGGSRLAVDAMLGRVAPEANPFRVHRPMESRTFDVL
ncbi:MAG: FAD-binding oxidoreductase [Chloroflexi bacterium]|nr:FAD-binding oxidoreductase [Chloroflexota bacterium]